MDQRDQRKEFYDRVYRNGARVEKALKIHRQNLQRKAERDQSRKELLRAKEEKTVKPKVYREKLISSSICISEASVTTERKAYRLLD